MNTLEKKVAALLQLATADNDADYNKAVKEIHRLLREEPVGEVPVREVVKKDPEDVVRDLLLEIGAPDHLVGHEYTLQAILLVMKDKKYLKALTTLLYPKLAKQFDSIPSRVERGIRHLIEMVWQRCDLDTLERYFGNTIDPNKAKATNGQFIARMATVAKQRLKQ